MHKGFGPASNIVHRSGAGIQNALFGRLDHIAHLAVDQAANDEVAAALLGQFATLLFHRARGLVPEAHLAGQLLLGEQAGVESVVKVVAVVSDFVGEVRDLRFERGGFGLKPLALSGMIVAGKVLGQTLAHFPGKVQSGEAGIFLLQLLDHAQALAVVLKPAVIFHQLVQYHLAFVPERGVTEVVRQRDGLRQVFVQLQSPGDVAGDGGDFDGVREPRAQMVASAVEEDLRFVFEPAKRARVNDAVAVALIMCAPVGRLFGVFASSGVGAELGVRREALAFELLQFFARPGHGSNSKCGMRNSEWS